LDAFSRWSLARMLAMWFATVFVLTESSRAIVAAASA